VCGRGDFPNVSGVPEEEPWVLANPYSFRGALEEVVAATQCFLSNTGNGP
jgi:hypothetical protein